MSAKQRSPAAWLACPTRHFLKVEASKFTEVGYVGRDVESMIRDLTEIAVEMTRQEKIEEIADKAELNVEERILDILLPPPKSNASGPMFDFDSGETTAPVLVPDPEPKDENFGRTREKLRAQLRSGQARQPARRDGSARKELPDH